MGEYNAYKHGGGGGDIEMNAAAERTTTNRTSISAPSTNEFTKKEQFLEDDGPDTDYKPVDWKRVLFTPKYLTLWIVLIIVGILTAIITLKHDQVVDALRPFAENVRNIPAGWLIFVAILFVISFPPLFGHELVALLAGVVYGLWIGFAVVSAGTFVGEIGTWFAFKKLLRKKAEKMERTNLTYGAMARMCRDGGFWIVFVIRLSVVPSHMSTAVFSTCDVKFWHFAVSTFFTLPKQLILVYLGVLLVGGHSDFLVKFALFGGAGVITFGAGVWIWIKMAAIKKDLLVKQELRKSRRALARNNSYNNVNKSPGMSEDLPPAGGPAWMHQDDEATANPKYSQPTIYEAYRPQTAENSAYVADGSASYPKGPYNGADDGDLGTYGRSQYGAVYDSPPRNKAEETRDFV